jgi:predicted ester cyclase
MQQSTEDLKRIVREFNLHIIQEGQWTRFSEFVHAEFKNHTAPNPTISGPDGFKAFFMNVLHAGLKNISVRIFDQIAELDRVATRKIIEGDHIGEFLRIPPTGKRIFINVTDIVRIREGKYFEHWGNADLLAAIKQMQGD